MPSRAWPPARSREGGLPTAFRAWSTTLEIAPKAPVHAADTVAVRQESHSGASPNLRGREADAIYGEWMRTTKLPSIGAEIVYVATVEGDLTGGSDFEQVELSRTGTLWSFTNNCYQPPAPYVSPDPFEPYAIAAVELATEQMVILGQVARGVELTSLKVGQSMELTVGTLFEDDTARHLIWNWRPVDGGARS